MNFIFTDDSTSIYTRHVANQNKSETKEEADG